MSDLKPKTGIMSLPAYVGGREKLVGFENPIKLSANETPLGASPKAIAAYRAADESLARYPDGTAHELRTMLGKKHGLNPEQIVCGCGSDELLQLLPQAYAGVGDEIIFTEHGFVVYKLATGAVGATPIAVAETNLTTDVDKILAAVTPRTKIIFLANPNNPTGTMIGRDELRRLHKGLRDDIILVLDGAYTEYVTDVDYDDGFDLAEKNNNVFVTRTFSKIHGLAALRLGWGYGAADIVQVLNRVRGAFNINSAALSAGLASVQDEGHIAKAVAHNSKWVAWLSDEIRACGFDVTPSKANFILVNFRGDAHAITAQIANAALQAQGIIVREMGVYGLGESLRISIGLETEMRQVAQVFQQLAPQSEGANQGASEGENNGGENNGGENNGKNDDA